MKLQQFFICLTLYCLGLEAQAQVQPILTCNALASRGYSNAAAQCNSTIAGKYLSPEADSVCNTLANSGYSSPSVECIKSSIEANFDSMGLDVCRELAANGYSLATVNCIKNLRNKMIDQRIIGSCLQLARTGYSSNAVDCVKNTVIGDLGSLPPNSNPNATVILNLIGRAREAVISRNTQSALKFLDRIEQLVRNGQ